MCTLKPLLEAVLYALDHATLVVDRLLTDLQHMCVRLGAALSVKHQVHHRALIVATSEIEGCCLQLVRTSRVDASRAFPLISVPGFPSKFDIDRR